MSEDRQFTALTSTLKKVVYFGQRPILQSISNGPHEGPVLQAICDILEATRQMGAAGGDVVAFINAVDAHKAAWERLQSLLEGA